MSNTSFHFRHMFLLSACSSQSHATCLSLMSHYEINNKCNWVKEWHWRWLIYALHNFLLRNNVTWFQKQPPLLLKVSQILQENTQRLIEKNNLGISNVNTPAPRYVLGYYTLYRLFTFRSKLDINLLFCFWLQY